jgi:hypothetical protein
MADYYTIEMHAEFCKDAENDTGMFVWRDCRHQDPPLCECLQPSSGPAQPPASGWWRLQTRGQGSILGQTMALMNFRNKNSFLSKSDNPHHYNYFSKSA